MAHADEIMKALKGMDSTKYNPQIQHLEKMDKLADGENDTLTDLNDIEIITFSIFRSLDEYFQSTYTDEAGKEHKLGGLPLLRSIEKNIRSLRGSRYRLGRKEWVDSHKPGTIHLPGAQAPAYQVEEEARDRRGFFEKLGDRFRGRSST